MSNSGRVHLVPDKTWIIDWYDGIIRGIARSQDRYYLFTMVAWDPDRGIRIYVVLGLDQAFADEMIRLCELKPETEEKWSQLDQIYDRYVMDYQNAAYFSNKEPRATESFAMIPIPPDLIPELRGFDIENTMDPKAQELWFNMQTDD